MRKYQILYGNYRTDSVFCFLKREKYILEKKLIGHKMQFVFLYNFLKLLNYSDVYNIVK